MGRKAGTDRLRTTLLIDFPGESNLYVAIGGHDGEEDWSGIIKCFRTNWVWLTPRAGDARMAEIQVRGLVKHLAQADPSFG